MKPQMTFGLKSSKNDEKLIVKRINDYLETHKRSMSKEKNESMLNARMPHVLSHFYWNLNKSKGTWFEIFSNEDLEGKYYDENNKDYSWIIQTRINLNHPMYEKKSTELFLIEVLKATSFEYFVLDERDDS